MGFDIYRKRFILKNQLMQLWCLRSSPLCHLQVRGQEGGWWRVSSRGQKGPITRGLVAESPALRWGPQLKQAGGKPKGMNSSFLCLWFSLGSQWVGCCSPPWGGPSVLLSLPIPGLIGNSLPDSLRKDAGPLPAVVTLTDNTITRKHYMFSDDF